jgi:ABC-type sulfate transport system permease component
LGGRLLPKKFTESLDKISSKKIVKLGVYITAIIVFFALILLPPILGIIIKWSAMQQILNEPEYMTRALNAVENSFLIAFFVSIIDIIAGLPMAWLIARGKSKWLNVLDTLCDIPFIVPTTALGYSLFLFWSKENGISALFGNTIISPGWLLVTLLHFTFSYPVVVRVIVGALLDYKMEYEQASRTLGAPPFIASRTVTLSIIKPSLIAAFILAFSRSISETGATIMVAGAFENGPTFIWNMQEEFSKVNPSIYEGSIVFASFLLIAISCIIFGMIRIFGPKLKLPIRRVWPFLERKLSYSPAATARNTTTLIIFLAIVLIPSLFVALPAFQALFTETLPNAVFGRGELWGVYWQSLLLSYSFGSHCDGYKCYNRLTNGNSYCKKNFWSMDIHSVGRTR